MASKQLSPFEKGQIVIYNDCDLSLGDIAKKLSPHQLMFSSTFLRKLEILIKKKDVVAKENSLHLILMETLPNIKGHKLF